METTKKEEESVNEQKKVLGKESEQSKASPQKSQGGPSAEQQAMDAQKAEGKGQASQRGAVGQEFEADRANNKKDGNGGGKGNPASSKDMPASPDTGKTVDKNSTKDKEAVDQYSKSNGKKKADENADSQPKTKEKGEKSKDDKAPKDASQDKKDPKEAPNADKKKEGKGEEERAGKEGDKKKDKEANAEERAEKSGGKNKKEGSGSEQNESAGSGEKKSVKEKGKKGASGAGGGGGGGGSVGTVKEVGGGGGGGGAINIPSIGGGGPEAPAPKGEGAGDSAIEAYANSGLSYQAENYGGLGEKVDADVDKAQTELDEKLPGEKDGEPFDAAKDAELMTKGSELQSKNDGISGDDFDSESGSDIDGIVENAALNVEAQKSAYESSGEEIPDSPTVESGGTEGIDAIRAEEKAKFNAAKADGPAKAAELDRTLPERGFEDIKVQKVDLDLESAGMTTGEVSITAAVAELTEEGKGILDISEVAEQVSGGMEDVKAQAKEADEKRDADIEAKIAEHDQAVEEAMQEAEQAEAEGREARQQEIESQIETDTATYDAEITAFDAEQQAEIDAGNAEIEQERQAAQSEIDQEHAKAKQEEQAAREEKDRKKGLLERIGDALSSAWQWFKDTVSNLAKAFVSFVSNALQKFANKVREIAGRVFNAIKEKWNQFKEKLTNFLKQLKDFIVEKWNEFVDWVKEQVNALIENLKKLGQLLLDGLKELWEAFKGLLKEVLSVVSSLLAQAAKFFMGLIKKACEMVGVDGSFLDQAMAVAEKIIQDPGAFASTMMAGFGQGFKNFGANWRENVIAIFQNLFNLWLGTAGLSLPGAFSVPCLIKFGLELLGVDVDGILKTFGLTGVFDEHVESASKKNKAWFNKVTGGEEEEEEEYEEPPSELTQFINEIKTNGIAGIVPYLQQHGAELAVEIRDAAIKAVLESAIPAAITKLASMATPASGIISAIKAVWDLIQFVRDNLSALASLGSAIGNCIATAAMGDTGAVATAVESAICQAIPILIDLLLRIVGVNVGQKIRGVVTTIQTKVKVILDKVLAPFRALAESFKKKAGKHEKKKEASAKDKKKAGSKANQAGYKAAEKVEKLTKKGKDYNDRHMFSAKGTADMIRGDRTATAIDWSKHDTIYGWNEKTKDENGKTTKVHHAGYKDVIKEQKAQEKANRSNNKNSGDKKKTERMSYSDFKDKEQEKHEQQYAAEGYLDKNVDQSNVDYSAKSYLAKEEKKEVAEEDKGAKTHAEERKEQKENEQVRKNATEGGKITPVGGHPYGGTYGSQEDIDKYSSSAENRKDNFAARASIGAITDSEREKKLTIDGKKAVETVKKDIEYWTKDTDDLAEKTNKKNKTDTNTKDYIVSGNCELNVIRAGQPYVNKAGDTVTALTDVYIVTRYGKELYRGTEKREAMKKFESESKKTEIVVGGGGGGGGRAF